MKLFHNDNFFDFFREYLSEIILTNNYNTDKIKTLLKSKFPNLKTNHVEKVIKDIQRYFLYQLKKKWQNSQRKSDRFKKENINWLNGVFTVQLEEIDSDLQNELSTKKKVGRPEKSFEKCCDRAKRYKVKHLR